MSTLRRWTTVSAEETESLAEKFAAELQPGDWVGLTGPLGAGKSVWARGIGRGLGVNEHIVSPSFTLANIYEGRVRFCHLDLYRLRAPEELADLGLETFADEHTVVVIEWATNLPGVRLPLRWEVNIERTGKAEDQREITVRENVGSRLK